MGDEVRSFEKLYEKYSLKKAKNVLKDHAHPLHKEYRTSDRSNRVVSLKTRTECFRKSFIPTTSRRLSESKFLGPTT